MVDNTQDAEDRLDPANDLLSSFNVATFKGSNEDDAAFWNRLITREERAPQAVKEVCGRGKIRVRVI